MSILHHAEGIDLMPANRELAALEMTLVNAMSREFVLKSYLDALRELYDYLLIDCPASLNMLALNALTAADGVVIPTQAQFLAANGMTELMSTISKVQRRLNPGLVVDGILLTLVDKRTNLSRVTEETLRREYGGFVRIYNAQIPIAVKAAETTTTGKSVFAYAPACSAASAYDAFVQEVLAGATD